MVPRKYLRDTPKARRLERRMGQQIHYAQGLLGFSPMSISNGGLRSTVSLYPKPL